MEGAPAAERPRVQRAAQAQHSTATEAADAPWSLARALRALKRLHRPHPGASFVPQQHHVTASRARASPVSLHGAACRLVVAGVGARSFCVSNHSACSFALCIVQSPEGIPGTSQPPMPVRAAGTAHLDIEAGTGKQSFDLITAGYPTGQNSWAVYLPPHSPTYTHIHPFQKPALPAWGQLRPCWWHGREKPHSQSQRCRTAASASAGLQPQLRATCNEVEAVTGFQTYKTAKSEA